MMHTGSLVIAGGALEAHESAIFSRFVSAAGGPLKRFAILPAATAEPLRSIARARKQLLLAGVQEGAIQVLELSETEPSWKNGAYEPSVIEKALAADGVWIPGGDQNAITRLLLRPEGGDSPLLSALRTRLNAGAAIGGTSAGAAVMSDPMIGGGTSFGALSLPRADGPGHSEIDRALWTATGLGFYAQGIIDQHFDARARLGRLIRAVLDDPYGRKLGFGVSEDSAMLCDAATGSFEVLGAAGVYVVDSQAALEGPAPNAAQRAPIRELALHYLLPGDRWDAVARKPLFLDKSPLSELPPAYALPAPCASGPLSPYGELAAFCGRLLFDNDEALLKRDARGRPYVQGYLIEELDGQAQGWELRFARQEGLSSAWLAADGRVAFQHARIDLIPLSIKISAQYA
ncbi:MAG TPA: cyanophycinase [Spirochaetaceae bacterium]|nr:cyanophycinase [Spirochaetaceae bacterium]